MAETTVPHVDVHIQVTSICPECNKKVSRQRRLGYDALATGNTTQRALFHADEMVCAVNEEIARRGWSDVRCGQCKDQP